MPTQMTSDKIIKVINTAIKTTNATSIKDMAKVMAILKAQLTGVADMSFVSKTLRDKLQ